MTSPSSLPYVSAFLIVLVSLAGATVFGPLHERGVIGLVALSVGGLAWWWCVARVPRAPLALGWIVLGAVLLRAVAWWGDPGTSDDVYRYVWEGEVVARGVSPYAFGPDAPELASLRAQSPRLAERVGHSAVSAAYPPLVQLHNAFAVQVVHACGAPWTATVALLRALAAGWDLLVLVPLVRLLRAAGRPPAMCVAWAWCPLVALEFAGAGHFDALGILLWIAGLSAARGLPVFLAGAIAVKWLPLASLPFVGRPRRAAAALALVALGFAPLVALEGGTAGLFRGLGEYALRWESTSLVYRFVEMPFRALPFGDPRLFARSAVALAWLAGAAWLWRRRTEPVRAAFLLTGLFLVLTPTLHPWYVTWIVPFLALFPRPAWCWLAASAPLAYALLGRWLREGVWEEPPWLWPAIALPFFALLACGGRAERRGAAA